MKKLIIVTIAFIILSVSSLSVQRGTASVSENRVDCISNGNGCYDGQWLPCYKEKLTNSELY